MSLASTAALVSIQDGSGAVATQATGATAVVTAGGLVTFSLQSTSGIQSWDLVFACPNYPTLHQTTFSWKAGMANALQVQMPAGGFNPATIRYASSVSDQVNGIASAYGFLQAKGAIPTVTKQTARVCAAVALAAYTNASGVLTANANGALANVDGVALAVGDFMLLPNGIAATAVDAGLYQVVSLGGAAAKFVFQLAPNWGNGLQVEAGAEIYVKEGTLYSGTTWVLTNTGTSTVGTTNMTFYPREVIQSVTLVAGTVTIANVPVLSTTKTVITSERTTANTTASTISYNTIGGKTAGALGTATLTYQACVAAGTINNADISTLAVSVRNPV